MITTVSRILEELAPFADWEPIVRKSHPASAE